MSFFDLNECLTVDGFLFWDHMIEEGWLVFNFDTLQDNRKPKAEVTKSKKGSPVVADVTMTGIVKVSQFDILYIKRENLLPEQFPLRVTFLADASKNVAAKCKEKQSLSSQEQLKLWMQQLMNFVAELEEEKGFNPLPDRKGFMKTCKIVLWTLPLSDALEYKNKKQKKLRILAVEVIKCLQSPKTYCLTESIVISPEKNAPGLLRFVWYMKYGIIWK